MNRREEMQRLVFRGIFKKDLEDLISDYLTETGNYNSVVYDLAGPMFRVSYQLHGRNQAKTAKALGMNRGTLRKYLLQYGIIK